MAGKGACYKCRDPLADPAKLIGCKFCVRWSHIKCANLSGIKSDNISHINWLCDECVQELENHKKTQG